MLNAGLGTVCGAGPCPAAVLPVGRGADGPSSDGPPQERRQLVGRRATRIAGLIGGETAPRTTELRGDLLPGKLQQICGPVRVEVGGLAGCLRQVPAMNQRVPGAHPGCHGTRHRPEGKLTKPLQTLRSGQHRVSGLGGGGVGADQALDVVRHLPWLTACQPPVPGDLVPARPLDAAEGDYEQLPQLRLANGVGPAQMRWPDLGYAGAYLGSYEIFSALRAEGVIPGGVRFQVEYPTPLASIGGYVVPEQQQVLLGSYERAMFADLGRLLAAIPPGEVAVQ